MTGTRPDLAPDDAAARIPGRRTYAAARRHTGLVRLLKFAIPVGAIVTVAAVFGSSYLNPLNRIPGLTVGPISVSGSKIAMERPKLTGFRNKDKRPYEVTATAAFQDIRKPNVIELKDMSAKMVIDEAGTLAHLRSDTGLMDTSKDHLDLNDNIRVWTARGEEMMLKSAAIDLKAGAVVSTEPVSLKTPTLTLSAGGMQIADSGKSIVFTGRVHTILIRGMEAEKDAGKPDKKAMARGQDAIALSRVAEAGDGR